MSGVVSTTLLHHFEDILSSSFAFVPLIISTFSLEKTAPAQVSPDDRKTDSDDPSKNKRPRKQSKGKSLEKTIERLRSIHEDKWGLEEYRLWATALVNCRRCEHEPFFIMYFYLVSTCMILGFHVFN